MENSNLQIHVFGGSEGQKRFGESILIRTPLGKWGMVDCCKGRVNHPLRFFSDNKVGKIAFALITHPHADHFSGLSELLAKIEIDKDAEIRRYLRTITNYDAVLGSLISGTPDQSADFISSAVSKDLAPIKDWADVRHPEILHRESEVDFCISVITPDGILCRDLDLELIPKIKNCFDFDEKGRPKGIKIEEARMHKRDIRSGINELSVCAHIQWGEFAGLLLADAEKRNLENAYKTSPKSFENLSFVKVAHHGGSGANPIITDDGKTLFEMIASKTDKDLIAAVTHYHHQLPSKNILKTIKKHCKELYIISPPKGATGYVRGAPASKAISSVSAEGLLAREDMGASCAICDDTEGCLSFSFDKTGKLDPNSIPENALTWVEV